MEEITGLLNKDNMDALVAAVSGFGLKLLAAIVVFVVGRWLVGRVTRLLEAGMKRADTDPTLIGFFRNIIYFGLLTMVVIAAVGQLGVQTTSFIAVLGAAGLAIGLALQGSLANFAAGVLMIIFRHFKAGDYVEVAGVAGSVVDLHLFTTTLRTPDNKIIVIPNAQVTGGTITNYSALDTRRLDLEFGVSYSDDLDHVKRVIDRKSVV